VVSERDADHLDDGPSDAFPQQREHQGCTGVDADPRLATRMEMRCAGVGSASPDVCDGRHIVRVAHVAVDAQAVFECSKEAICNIRTVV
jgi:hypothetical protein